MMRGIRSVTGGLACCLLLAAAAEGFGQERGQTRVSETRAGSATAVRKLSVVLGSTVQLQGGVTLGKVEDIVINDQGCIEYAVVAFEERFVVIPWTVATVNFEQRTLVVDVTRDRLREVTFTRDSWPNFTDRQFRQRVQTVFGERAFRREGGFEPRARERTTEPDRSQPRPEARPSERGERPERTPAPSRPDVKPPQDRRPDQPGTQPQPAPDRQTPPRDQAPPKPKDQKPPRE